MHDIEPYFGWRSKYTSESDRKSPFYGREYSEFSFSNKVYNYFIHPQWDSFGSETLYVKIIFVDYDENYAFIELLGEWNDCLGNDIMHLKRAVIDPLIKEDVYHFVLFCDNVLNFHNSDDSYYEEWYDDIKDEQGQIYLINVRPHIIEEMSQINLQFYVHFGDDLSDIIWQKKQAPFLLKEFDQLVSSRQKTLM